MKIQFMSCPRCGGAIRNISSKEIQFCSYCGAPLHVDDGTKRIHKTMVIRDEARILEAELASRKLEMEMELLRKKEERLAIRNEKISHTAIFIIGNTLKTIVCIIGILLIAVFGLIYLISPIDLLSGFILDDIGVAVLCYYLISNIGKCMGRHRQT